MKREDAEKRDMDIWAAYQAGTAVAEISKKYDTSAQNVYRILHKFDDKAGHDKAANGSANEVQVGGDHYKLKPIQPWDFIAANGLDFFEGNIVKYVSRWRTKGGKADLEKARHYLDKLIEMA